MQMPPQSHLSLALERGLVLRGLLWEGDPEGPHCQPRRILLELNLMLREALAQVLGVQECVLQQDLSSAL